MPVKRIDGPDLCRITLRDAVIGEQAVGLLLHVGQLCVAEAVDQVGSED